MPEKYMISRRILKTGIKGVLVVVTNKNCSSKKATLKFRGNPWSEISVPLSGIDFYIVTFFLA